MALTETEKTEVRRHCGYPMFGDTPNQAFAHRFMTHYGTLEYRMNHLSETELVVVRNYLTALAQLEAAELATGGNLDTAAAAVWTRNPNEHRDRQRLYQSWQAKLLGFFGVPPGPSMMRGNTIELVI